MGRLSFSREVSFDAELCICSRPVAVRSVTDRPADTLGRTGVLRRTAAIRGAQPGVAQPAAERRVLRKQAVNLRLQRLEVLLLPCP